MLLQHQRRSAQLDYVYFDHTTHNNNNNNYRRRSAQLDYVYFDHTTHNNNNKIIRDAVHNLIMFILTIRLIATKK